MAPLRILIQGAGIAGPALAFWLSKQPDDYAITLLERVPNLRATGHQIDLRGEGLLAMRRMGLEPRVRAHLVDEQGLRFLDHRDGRPLACFAPNKSGRGKQSISAEFEIMRGDLVRILYDETHTSCQYRFGVSIDRFEQRGGNGVWCLLSDGSEGEWDLLVGADGQNSRTRRRLFGDEDDAFFDFKNLYFSYFTVPRKETDTNYANVVLLPGNRALFTRADNPNTMQVCLGFYTPTGECKPLDDANQDGWDANKAKAGWADIFQGVVGWEAPRLLGNMLHADTAQDFHHQKIGQVKLPSTMWSKGRVVLLGDAAYCPSPISGFGTSLSMVGAYVLAGELVRARGGQRKQHQQQQYRDVDNDGSGAALDAALVAYESSLRPLVEKAQHLPPGMPGLLFAKSSRGVWWRNFVLRVVAMLRVHKLVERLLPDEIGGKWKMPDYPELQYE